MNLGTVLQQNFGGAERIILCVPREMCSFITIKIVDKRTDVQQTLKKRGAISHRGIMNERLLIRASRVTHAPELDFVVKFVSRLH